MKKTNSNRLHRDGLATWAKYPSARLAAGLRYAATLHAQLKVSTVDT